MFEKEIKSINEFSLNKLRKLGGFFTLEQIRSAKLHPAIIRYIEAEIDFLIYQDRKKLLHNSAFDYSNPEIQNHFNEINAEIKKNKTISFEDAKNLIMQAVSFTANYVARPKWSLTKFTFNQDQLKPIEEIKLSLNYLYYYDYLRNVLNAFIDKKKTLNISLVDFEVTLNKIDNELFNQHTQKLVDNALDSISDFFSIGENNKNTVSSNAVEVLLKEKDLIDYLFRLRRSLPISNNHLYKISDIQNIIYSNVTVEKTEVGEKIETELLNENKFEQETEKIQPEIEEKPDKQEEPESVPTNINREAPPELFKFDEEIAEEKTDEEIKDNLPGNEVGSADENPEEIIDEEVLNELNSDEEYLQEFDIQLKALEEASKLLKSEIPDELEEENFTDETPPENVEGNDAEETETTIESNDAILFPDEEIAENPDIEQDDLFPPESVEEPLNEFIEEDKQEEEIELPESENEITRIPEIEKPQRGKDVFSFLSDKEIDKIVSNVFNEDREDFATTMERVSECMTYSEATEILKSVFFSYRVNPYTRDAVTLTNAVSNYFSQA